MKEGKKFINSKDLHHPLPEIFVEGIVINDINEINYPHGQIDTIKQDTSLHSSGKKDIVRNTRRN